MQYRTFKKTGEQISLLGFGTMRLPVNPDGKIDEAEAIRMIRRAIDSGVNYVDTAYMYHNGESEVVLGKALKDGYREKVLLADKLPLWLARDEDGHRQIFEEQFKRLDVDTIDMYLIHNLTAPIWKITKKLNVLDFLEKEKAKGKIKHIGFSFHDDVSVFKEIIDSYNWDFCQIQLNYMDIEWQAGVEGLKYAADRGVPVIIMEPLKGGHLTDAFPEKVAKFWDESDTKMTPAEWAFRWVADFPEVLTILSGMSDMSQVEDNLRILSNTMPNSLTDKDLDVYKKVSDMYNELIQYPCTSCGYCMPCKQKINIPDMMVLYNEWFLYAQSKKTQASFNMFFQVGQRPSDCLNCKACEEHCPQHLNISEMMEKAAAIFEK